MFRTEKAEQHRYSTPPYVSKHGDPFGVFRVPFESNQLMVMAVDGKQTDWEHVSISLKKRCPNWREMCMVKDLFWDDTDTVVQFHVPKVDYINVHSYCLHLWRYTKGELPRPPSILVGPKGLNND